MSPTALPTPAPSTEILPGKRVNSLTGQIDAAFSLPPAAIANSNSDTTSVKSLSPVNSDSSYRPLSPPSVPSASSRTEKAPTATRRRSSAAASQANATNQNGYTIPPPPTRSRKIIQMKPRGQAEAQDESLDLAKNHPAIAPSSQAKDTKNATTSAGSKRKQSGSGGPTTAAGRKIARKTAHSLIERRRRSKMNEEFGVLKNMIPACNGSDMHKLASKSLLVENISMFESNTVTSPSSKHRIHELPRKMPCGSQVCPLALSTYSLPTSPTSSISGNTIQRCPSCGFGDRRRIR